MICLGCATFELQGLAVQAVADAYRRAVLGRVPDPGGVPLSWTDCATAELAMLGQPPPPDGGWVDHARRVFEIPDVRPLDPSDHVTSLLPEAAALVAGCGGVVADTVDRFQDEVWWGGVGLRSSTHPLVPRLTLLGENATRLGEAEEETPVAVAEALLHEAAHSKLIDVLLVRPVFRDVGPDLGYVPSWQDRIGDDRWHVMRVLAAAHVYVHLVAFHTTVDAGGDRLDHCRARAAELFGFLDRPEVRACTKPSGAAFLDAMAAAAGPEGAALACGSCADPAPPVIEVTSDAVGCAEVGSQLVTRGGAFFLELSA